MVVYPEDLGSVEVEVPINIALIKYWGKRDEELILPVNSSVSLNIDALVARTRVSCSMSITDSVKINDTLVDLEKNKRFRRCFDFARHLMRKRLADEDLSCVGPGYGFEVSSTTNFPVGAGLASSAAGFAAIAVAIGHLCNFSTGEVSTLARLGSGSACRSVFGGLVEWCAGSEKSGVDCISKQVLPEEFWPELRAVIVVLDEAEKEVGSSIGMRRSMETSELLKHRAHAVVPERIKRITLALKERNFDEFARITMADSNQLHAVCLDTFPPLKYMTDASWCVVRAVNELNSGGRNRAAYSFDAGPNACIFVEDQNIASLLEHLSRYLSLPENIESAAGITWPKISHDSIVPNTNFAARNLIVSKVGGPPRIVS